MAKKIVYVILFLSSILFFTTVLIPFAIKTSDDSTILLTAVFILGYSLFSLTVTYSGSNRKKHMTIKSSQDWSGKGGMKHFVLMMSLFLVSSTAMASDQAHLSIESTSPALPASLRHKQQLNINISYRLPSENPVQIWARPYTNGRKTSGFIAHPSPLYPKGSGRLRGYFYFEQDALVDEIRVEMKETVSGKILKTISIPVLAVWGGDDVVLTKVPGTANPWLAGMPDGTSCCGDKTAGQMQMDTVPGQSPVLVKDLELEGKVAITFRAWGGAHFGPGPRSVFSGPDGRMLNNNQFEFGARPALLGKTGIKAPMVSLLGVFLGYDSPSYPSGASDIDYVNDPVLVGRQSFKGYLTESNWFAPKLSQVFYIGDGVGRGVKFRLSQTYNQYWEIPRGTKRFFLGIMDGAEWSNNPGAFFVRYQTLGQTELISRKLELAVKSVNLKKKHNTLLQEKKRIYRQYVNENRILESTVAKLDKSQSEYKSLVDDWNLIMDGENTAAEVEYFKRKHPKSHVTKTIKTDSSGLSKIIYNLDSINGLRIADWRTQIMHKRKNLQKKRSDVIKLHDQHNQLVKKLGDIQSWIFSIDGEHRAITKIISGISE